MNVDTVSIKFIRVDLTVEEAQEVLDHLIASNPRGFCEELMLQISIVTPPRKVEE